MFQIASINPLSLLDRFTVIPDLDKFAQENGITLEKPNLYHQNSDGNSKTIQNIDDQTFLKSIESTLKLLEIFRLTKLHIYHTRKKIGVVIATIGTPITGFIDYWLLLLQSSSDDNLAGLTAIFLGILYCWVTAPKREYIKGYKIEILPRIAKLFGDFTYDIKGKIPMSTLQPSQIIPSHDKYRTEDYFEGTYKGVDISFCEAKLAEMRGSGKNRRTVTVFKGLFILLTMRSKKFLGHTILERDKSKIVKWFEEKSSNLKHARMVDPEFEKIFDAYTNDQVEARYLIDPIMIENLKSLYKEYQGKTMAAAWYDTKMLIALSSDYNHFEPSDIHIPATDPKSLLSLKKELSQILSIIDKLNLYNPRDVEKINQSNEEKAV